MAQPVDKLRVAAGLCVAAHVPILIVLAMSAFAMSPWLSRAEGTFGKNPSWEVYLTSMAGVYLGGLFSMAAIALVFGLPVLVALRRLGRDTWGGLALAGAVIGGVAAWLVDLAVYHADLHSTARAALDARPGDLLVTGLMVAGAICGALSGLVFRAVAYRKARA